MSDTIKGKALSIELVLHYAVILFTSAIITFAILYAFIATSSVSKQSGAVTLPDSGESKKAAAKLLPDFLIDDMNSDELGQLKP